jgi:SAM-dependent methyltransferase
VAVHDEGDLGHDPSVTQYETDANLAARQRLWAKSPRDRDVDIHGWVLGLAGLGGGAGGQRVLEVGCGNGTYLRRLPSAIGMDLSYGMLTSARSTGATLVNGDAERLPFADNAFDVVLAPHMLYHVPDRVAAAREMRRVLRDGGVCVAATNGERNHPEMVRLIEEVVGRDWRWDRSAVVAFSMENGADQLRAGFDEVERIYADSSTFFVDDAELLAAYIASVGDLYGPEVEGWIGWNDVVDGCRRRVAEVIERDGHFTISTSIGAFVCR